MRVVRLAEDEPFSSAEIRITPIPLAAENAYAFLFEGGGQRVLDRDGRDAAAGSRPTSARSTSR